MYILIMVLAIQGKSITMSQSYYEDEYSCKQAAIQFMSHNYKSWWVTPDAFCIRSE